MVAPRYHRDLPEAVSDELWRRHRGAVLLRTGLGLIAGAMAAVVLPNLVLLAIVFGDPGGIITFGDIAGILLLPLFVYAVLAFGAAHWVCLRIGVLTRRRYAAAGAAIAGLPLLFVLPEVLAGGDVAEILLVAAGIAALAGIGAGGGLALWAIAIRDNRYFNPPSDAVAGAVGDRFE